MAVGEWAFKVVSSFLPQYKIPAGSRLGGLMQGLFGMNPAEYNIWQELGFLAEPLIQTMVSPAVNRMLAGMTDEQVRELAGKFVDAFIEQARDKGSVNLFGIELKEDAFKGLKGILAKRLKEEE